MCCHCAGEVIDHYFLLLLKNFLLRMLPTLSCHRSSRVNVTCESCGMAEKGCSSWDQRKGEELLVLHSSVADRALSPPFFVGLQVIFRKNCLYSMAWQRGGGEAGFLRAAAAMTFLAIIDTPSSSSGTSCKAAKVWVGSEWKGKKIWFILFISWKGAETSGLSYTWNWWFKPSIWPVTVVELCGKGPQALVPTCG